MFKRKIDYFLDDWYKDKDHQPLIIYGSRQVGKTTSIKEFAKKHYESVIEINFDKQPQYKKIFQDGYDPDNVNYNISLINSDARFISSKTLVFFDEIQDCVDAVTSLKFYKEDGRFDVICSGSMLGINYKRIKSISVGYQQEYLMYSMDFEEFLWANGYDDSFVERLYDHMINIKPFSELEMNALSKLFKQYMLCGGFPEVVKMFVEDKTFERVVKKQKQLYSDYENDIKKYVEGLDVAKVVAIYEHITSMLARDNHKLQYSVISKNARAREYMGCDEWLKQAGIIVIAHNVDSLNIPLVDHEIMDEKRIYYMDNALLMASLDEDSLEDIRVNNNFEIYNGAVTESIVAEALIKSGYDKIFYYKNDDRVELDFVNRAKNEIVPLEVKTSRGRTSSLNRVIESRKVKFGIKLTSQNIGYANNKYTFPYFLTFLVRRFLKEKVEW